MRLGVVLKKELIQLVKNPKMRATLLVPPLMQLIMLGYAATLELKRVDLGVWDRSRSATSRELIARFDGGRTFRLHPPLTSEREMATKIDERTLQVVLAIPSDFEEAILQNRTPELQIIVDGRGANSAGLATAYVQNVVSDFFLRRETGETGGPRLDVRSRAWFNPNYNARFFMVPAVLAMIALIDMILLNALSIAKERDEGTFDQLRLTPIATWEILTAKGFASIAVGIVQLALGLIVVRCWFGVPLASSPVVLAALLISFLFASMGIGLLISVLCRNLQQAIFGAFSVVVPFAMLSGLSSPAESMPEILQQISMANPLRHGVAALPRIFLEGTTLFEIRFTLYFLWGIAVLGFVVSCFLFQRQRRAG